MTLRYVGAGIGYQLASVIARRPAPLVATWLLAHTGSTYSSAGDIDDDDDAEYAAVPARAS